MSFYGLVCPCVALIVWPVLHGLVWPCKALYGHAVFCKLRAKVKSLARALLKAFAKALPWALAKSLAQGT